MYDVNDTLIPFIDYYFFRLQRIILLDMHIKLKKEN